MEYLTADELKSTYYKKATSMGADEVAINLARANSYAQGVIGGALPADKVDTNLKAAVALAFEIMTRGETSQVDPVNGNITEAAPTSPYVQSGFSHRRYNPMDTVDKMLKPYAALYDQLNKATDEHGFMFMGG